MNTTHKRGTIIDEANVNLEDGIDIQEDVKYLMDFNGVNTLTTYNKALIHSQLFETPLNRQMSHLYTLNEFSKLPKHTNSFVCFHDEGLLNLSYIVIYIYFENK